MYVKDKSVKSNGRLLEFATRALTQHEQELDRLVNRLSKVKNDLLVNLEKSDQTIDDIAQKLEDLEKQIHKLKPS
jgi:archaellum component FlaC